jgi:hypothetical protein
MDGGAKGSTAPGNMLGISFARCECVTRLARRNPILTGPSHIMLQYSVQALIWFRFLSGDVVGCSVCRELVVCGDMEML